MNTYVSEPFGDCQTPKEKAILLSGGVGLVMKQPKKTRDWAHAMFVIVLVLGTIAMITVFKRMGW